MKNNDKNIGKETALPKEQVESVIALYSSGKIEEAIIVVKSLNEDYPNVPLLFNILGACYKKLDQLEASIKMFETAIAIKPDYAEVHNNLGITHMQLEQLDAAVESFNKAIAINPNFAEAHNNLGIVLVDLGQLDNAVKYYEKAIVIKPNFAEAHNNLGNALKALGQFDASIKSYKNALAIKSNFVEAHNNLGIVFKNLGQLVAATACYEKALAINPEFADAYNNLGIIFKELGKLNSAADYYHKALAINPNFAEVHSNLGNVLRNFKRMDEALLSFERGFSLKPQLHFLLGELIHIKGFLCIWDDLPNCLIELKNKINNNEKVAHPSLLLSLIDDPELQRKASEIYINHKHIKNHDLSKVNHYPRHPKIRIGYFSADFRNHPVADLTAELYEVHDRNLFEIYAFSFGPDTKDEMNLRIKAGVDHFYDVRTMSHKEVVILARSFEIDIAVDLGGFTQYARPEIFAMSAAPIQLGYIGYLGTMGANYYDYLLADQIMIPEKNQKYYSEKIVYLPCFQVNDSTQSPPSTIYNRKDIGLPEEGFVFCCFNNTYKITPTTFDSWGRILSKVEGSVLLIYADNKSAQLNLTKEIVLRGIKPSRLIFGKRLPRPEYLARYRVADLFLDTHPYNAGATSSDALRMGLPVLTYAGNSFASRMGASILNAINLPELVTTTPEEYESLAIKLATHPEKFKIIKDKLVSNLSTAPLYDTPVFAQHLESAYKAMYDGYQKGLKKDHIYVEE